MKKSAKKIVAVILSFVMLATSTKFTKAASQEYLSDVMVYYASSFEEAEKGLHELGYEIVKKGNLNATFKTGVYLGYKTTENPDEAITDLAAMNMNGNYSYGSYETIMETQKDSIKASIENFLPSLAAFQENYNNGTKAADLAYKTLNIYKEDDSGLLMGDYLLAYDFSDKAEDEMIKIFMEGNAQIILSIQKVVAMASENEGETIMERMSDLGPDGVMSRYEGAYPTLAKALQAMSKDYDAIATEVLAQWNNMYNYLQAVKEELLVENGDEIAINSDAIEGLTGNDISEGTEVPEELEEVVDLLNTTEDQTAVADAITDASLYLILEDTEFGDGTLLDYFNRPADEISLTDLYVFVEAMTNAEKSQIGIMGLRDTLLQGIMDFENADGEAKDMVDSYETGIEDLEEISVYSGIDRSIFEDGVAFTDKATQNERLTGRSWTDTLFQGQEMKDTYLQAIIYSSIATVVFTVYPESSGCRSRCNSGNRMDDDFRQCFGT